MALGKLRWRDVRGTQMFNIVDGKEQKDEPVHFVLEVKVPGTDIPERLAIIWEHTTPLRAEPQYVAWGSSRLFPSRGRKGKDGKGNVRSHDPFGHFMGTEDLERLHLLKESVRYDIRDMCYYINNLTGVRVV